MFARCALIATFALLVVSGAAARTQVAAPGAPRVACPRIVGAVSHADIDCALRRWFHMANTRNPQAVTDLYSDGDVMLLSTLGARPFITHGEIGTYFQGLVTRRDFQVSPSRIVSDKIDLFHGGGAVSGYYMFHWVQDSRPKDTPARFTFVFVLNRAGDALLIATHHSSAVPTEAATRAAGRGRR
jgi:hypothetical protein